MAATKSKSDVPPENEAPSSSKAAAKGGSHRRASSSVTDVYKPAELSMPCCFITSTDEDANQFTEDIIGEEGTLRVAKEISRLNWFGFPLPTLSHS